MRRDFFTSAVATPKHFSNAGREKLEYNNDHCSSRMIGVGFLFSRKSARVQRVEAAAADAVQNVQATDR